MNEKTFNLLIVAAIVFLILRGGDPNPPGPEPKPPTPDVDPAPFPSTGLSVLIVEETADRRELPLSQLSVLTSVLLREKVTQLGGEIRVWDKDIEAEYEASKWREAMRKPRDSLPWIYIANGDKGFSGELPETLEKTIQLVEKYK